MIRSFGNPATEDIFNRVDSKQARRLLPVELHKVAKRKLEMVHYAISVKDLKNPPGRAYA